MRIDSATWKDSFRAFDWEKFKIPTNLLLQTLRRSAMRKVFLISFVLFSFIFYACHQANVSEQKTVFIYNGPGVSQECIEQLELAVRKILPNYPVEYIGPLQVINDFWEEKAAFFVITGGADIPYTQALNGPGNQKIKRYIERGGAFLGICAGSYYSGAIVDFAKNTPFEVHAERELALFPGTVKGPALAQYYCSSQKGSRAAQLTWVAPTGFAPGEKFTIFYNGGGYFVEAANDSNTSVLAYYDQSKNWPAIIECRVGKGMAILSGVHFEYDPCLLDSDDPYLKTVLPLISADNQHREKLLTHLFERLLSKDVKIE